LYCLFLDLQFVITPIVSSSFTIQWPKAWRYYRGNCKL
jgi:hypothetical protein